MPAQPSVRVIKPDIYEVEVAAAQRTVLQEVLEAEMSQALGATASLPNRAMSSASPNKHCCGVGLLLSTEEQIFYRARCNGVHFPGIIPNRL
jgi:hypothetical protein